MTDAGTRVIAVDWSGAAKGAEKTIWIAEAVAGQIVRLENGRTRDQLIKHLIELQPKDPNIVVGLDFAFSMPEWFVEQQGATSGPEFWDVVAQQGETWLRECPSPFWGRAGTTMPQDVELLRRTERNIKELGGPSPKSVFQIAGGGHVGTGSIRGMPYLRKLMDSGWRIWPFHSPGPQTVIEIYPRILTRAVVKRSSNACREYLVENFPSLEPMVAMLAASSEDAFDATVSALVMDKYRENLSGLCRASEMTKLLEGRIWDPIGTIV